MLLLNCLFSHSINTIKALIQKRREKARKKALVSIIDFLIIPSVPKELAGNNALPKKMSEQAREWLTTQGFVFHESRLSHSGYYVPVTFPMK